MKRSTATDLPVQSFTNWDSIGIILQALTDLEYGIFRNPSLLWDAMLSDDRIFGTLGTRINALLGLKFSCEPADDSKKAKVAADALTEQWDTLFSTDAISEFLRWSHGLAFSLGELMWERGGSAWTFRLKVWNPQFVYWNWQSRTFWVTTMEGLRELDARGDGQFMLYMPHGAQRGWIYGLVRTLARPWIMRQWTLRDWARYCESYGMPLRKIIAPMGAQERTKERALQQYATMSTDMTVLLEQQGRGDTATGWDLQLLEAKSTGWETFKACVEQVNDSIAITTLGQNLTTEVRGGAYAAAAVHDRVRADYLRADANTAAATIREQALKWWAFYNYGDPELAPWPKWNTDPPEDKGAKAKSWFDLGNAVSLLQRGGFNVDILKAAEQFEIPLDADTPLLPIQIGSPPNAGGQWGGASGSSGNGNGNGYGQNSVGNRLAEILGDDWLARLLGPAATDPSNGNWDTNTGSAPRWDELGGDEDAKPGDYPDLWDEGDDKRNSRLLELLKALTPEDKRGNRYTDAVVRSLLQRSSDSASADLAKLLAVIDASADFESLRAGIVAAFPKMNRKALETLIYRAVVLAQLKGREVEVTQSP